MPLLSETRIPSELHESRIPLPGFDDIIRYRWFEEAPVFGIGVTIDPVLRCIPIKKIEMKSSSRLENNSFLFSVDAGSFCQIIKRRFTSTPTILPEPCSVSCMFIGDGLLNVKTVVGDTHLSFDAFPWLRRKSIPNAYSRLKIMNNYDSMSSPESSGKNTRSVIEIWGESFELSHRRTFPVMNGVSKEGAFSTISSIKVNLHDLPSRLLFRVQLGAAYSKRSLSYLVAATGGTSLNRNNVRRRFATDPLSIILGIAKSNISSKHIALLESNKRQSLLAQIAGEFKVRPRTAIFYSILVDLSSLRCMHFPEIVLGARSVIHESGYSSVKTTAAIRYSSINGIRPYIALSFCG